MNKTLTEKKIKMSHKCINTCFISLITGSMKIKMEISISSQSLWENENLRMPNISDDIG